jgi:hypothetical protein
MLPALLVGTALLLFGVACHGLASSLIVRMVAAIVRRGFTGRLFWKNAVAMMATTLIVTAAHLLNIAVWAAAFLACGEFTDFDTAFYHSAVNYTTLGYGDVVMREPWRLLGPFEALNGILFFGLSTAVMFAVLSRLFEARLKHHRGQAHDQPGKHPEGGPT